jgi:MYXO-CTERM domain-containing protein
LGAAVTLTPQQRATILANLPPLAAGASAPAPSAAPDFWQSASDTEKVVIVGAGVGAVALVWLALKRKRRR